MNAQIKYQKLLMETALTCLEGIEYAEKVKDDFVKQTLQKKYAETMSTLAGELAVIGETKKMVLNVTIHDQIHY